MNATMKFARKPFILVSPLLASLLVMGCSTVPPYETLEIAVPDAYRETTRVPGNEAQAGIGWKVAEPSDELPRGEWWTVFEDETLNALQQEALQNNLDLKAGLARIKQARALERNARSAKSPQVEIGFGPTRQRSSATMTEDGAEGEARTTTVWRGQAFLSYELDLFGRIDALASAANFDLQRNAALFSALQLTLQADIAQAYFFIRELDTQKELFTHTVALRKNTVDLFQHRFEEGEISELDLARVSTELSSAQSELIGIERQRAIAVYALAVLLGRVPADFSLEEKALQKVNVSIPVALPSALLERRPDIAAAERAVLAANMRVGAAKAAYFPRISLTGSLGYESSELDQLFRWSSRSFLLGPLAGTILTLPVFDGGAREANLRRNQAIVEEEAVNYQKTVLEAFKEVEDNLLTLRSISEQMQRQDASVQSASRAAYLSQLLYREGSASYLDVIDADRSVLQQRRVAVQLEGERIRAAVDLIRALGGGWREEG